MRSDKEREEEKRSMYEIISVSRPDYTNTFVTNGPLEIRKIAGTCIVITFIHYHQTIHIQLSMKLKTICVLNHRFSIQNRIALLVIY